MRHWGMRVLLRFTVDIDPDAAWRALHSPRALAELYGPLLELEPLTAPPTSWSSGQDAAVRMTAGGVPFGTQLIAVTDRTVPGPAGDVRILRDAGAPLTGPLAALDVWDHQIAVSAAPGDRTLWRERLVIGGRAAPLLWPSLWATWQWRARRIRALAPGWAH
ncbi:MAG: hypothetical protein QM626_05960, partial [Microbacterium sp.]|uniref:hypothetical protein n=1 Tax=Microbacterium sp. TaxID=51671 RepID=UPI0039E603C5